METMEVDGNTPENKEDENLSNGDSKKKNGGDLRQKSLAMYKSINNMLTLVNKRELAPIVKVSLEEVEGMAMDFCYKEVGPLSNEDYKAIRATVDKVMRPEILEESHFEKKDEIVFIDCLKLKSIMKKDLAGIAKEKEKREVILDLNVEVAIAATQGHRKAMEDFYSIIHHWNELFGFKDQEEQAFFAIYDGHSGRAAAEYAKTHLHVNLARDPAFKTDLFGAIQNCYSKTDYLFNLMAGREGMTSGTTAVTVLVRAKKMYIANVGDSEAVLCQNGKARVVTFAHLPDKAGEKERIYKSGGTVVWYGTWRVNGLLSVSRSIGDNSLKDVCIPVPFISELERSPKDEFLILATDGLWDVVSYQEACDLVIAQQKVIPRKEISQFIVDEALRKKTGDNVAVLIVFFDK